MTSRSVAIKQVQMAIESGRLVRASSCELCGFEPKQTVGHHWRGYDHPLDVWWICQRCNIKLSHMHDGRLTKAQARKVAGPHPTKPLKRMSISLCAEDKRLIKELKRLWGLHTTIAVLERAVDQQWHRVFDEHGVKMTEQY